MRPRASAALHRHLGVMASPGPPSSLRRAGTSICRAGLPRDGAPSHARRLLAPASCSLLAVLGPSRCYTGFQWGPPCSPSRERDGGALPGIRVGGSRRSSTSSPAFLASLSGIILVTVQGQAAPTWPPLRARHHRLGGGGRSQPLGGRGSWWGAVLGTLILRRAAQRAAPDRGGHILHG